MTTPAQIEAAARAVYGAILSLRNPFGKTWDELSDGEQTESRILARHALEAAERAAWRPISEYDEDTMADDVLVTGHYDESLPEVDPGMTYVSERSLRKGRWDVAGCMLQPTHFRPLPTPPTGELTDGT